jgi:NuA3 HAT complex component NTO1
MDLKERKRMAKRRVKIVEPLLKQVVQDEKDISGRVLEEAQVELNRLLEGNFESQRNLAPTSISEGGLSIAAAGDVVMTDAGERVFNGVGNLEASFEKQAETQESNTDRETVDVEMGDVLQEDTDNVERGIHPNDLSSEMLLNGDSITIAPLAEVNGNISPAKVNGAKATPPNTDDYVSAPVPDQPGPPTPPTSNTDMGNEQGSSILTDGGIHPALLKDFRIDGTNISAIEGSFDSNDSSGLSDAPSADEDMAEPVAVVARTSKAKKGKAKKRRR